MHEDFCFLDTNVKSIGKWVSGFILYCSLSLTLTTTFHPNIGATLTHTFFLLFCLGFLIGTFFFHLYYYHLVVIKFVVEMNFIVTSINPNQYSISILAKLLAQYTWFTPKGFHFDNPITLLQFAFVFQLKKISKSSQQRWVNK